MPSPIDCNFNARQRAAPRAGNSGNASPTVSRYSQINWLPNSDKPSSVTNAGTLDSGFCASRSAGEACGLLGVFSMRPSMPRMMAHAMTLRTYGLVPE